MERIVHTLRESCSIAVLDGHDAVYVARVAAKRIMSINLVVGSRLPAHATSMGKVLLAHLSDASSTTISPTAPLQRLTSRTIVDEPTLRAALQQVRERGWAFADQESEDGVRTVAVPLFDRNMRVQAAMNVSGHASRVPMKELRSRYLPVLMETANEISRALGANVPPPRAAAERRATVTARSGDAGCDTGDLVTGRLVSQSNMMFGYANCAADRDTRFGHALNPKRQCATAHQPLPCPASSVGPVPSPVDRMPRRAGRGAGRRPAASRRSRPRARPRGSACRCRRKPGSVPAVVVGDARAAAGDAAAGRAGDTRAPGRDDSHRSRAARRDREGEPDEPEIGAGQLWGRIAGFPSGAKTAAWSAEQFRRAGIADVKIQPITQDANASFWLPLSWEVQAARRRRVRRRQRRRRARVGDAAVADRHSPAAR